MRHARPLLLLLVSSCFAGCAESPPPAAAPPQAGGSPETAGPAAGGAQPSPEGAAELEPQSEVCKKLVACMGAAMPEPGASKQYEPSGSCWKSKAEADTCTKACAAALDGLKTDPKVAENAACK